MSSKGYALARAALIRTLTAYSGITSEDGEADGTTLVDSNLIDRNDFIKEKTILIMSGDAKDEDKGATSFDPDTGTITLQGTGFNAQIKAGTIYRVLNISTVEMDVANIATNIDTLLTRVTAAVALEATLTAIKGAGWTDENLTAIDSLIDAIKVVTDALPDAGALNDLAAILVDTGTTLPATLANIAGYIDTEIGDIKTQTDKIAGKMLFSMDFWSVPQVSLTVPEAPAASQPLPDVVVANLPTDATIVAAKGMLKFRMIENTNAGANTLSGAQHIQIQKGGAGGYADCISLVDLMFATTAETKEGGDVMIGDHNVVAKVDANATYNFQWTDALAALASLVFGDIQTGIRIWYSI